MLEKPRAGCRCKGLFSPAASVAETIPTPGYLGGARATATYVGRGKLEEQCIHRCYLLSPTKLTPGLQGDPSLPLTSEVHIRVAPWMDPLTPPAFQKCSMEDARKHTRILFNYLMHIPDTQVVVISNCGIPTFILGGESCMKSISFEFGKIYCQYTKERCCCSSRKAPLHPSAYKL